MASMLDSIFSARIFKGGVEYMQRKTIEFIGAGVTIADDPVNGRTQITITSSATAEPHEESHLYGGSDEIEGDRLRIEYDPTHYSRVYVPPLVTDADQLTAHLAGIDEALRAAVRVRYVTVAGTSHAFAVGEAYATFLCTNAGAIALQIPTHATVPFEVGTVLCFVPMAAGQITVSGAVGVTLVSGGGELKSLRLGGPMFAQQTALDAWLISGEKTV